jgi:hypothetical protein
MTTPAPATVPSPRASMPRSSFAMAMKDYTFVRPGIAVTVSAATLVVALILGLDLIRSLRAAAASVDQGAHASQTLHRYNAGLEVWRQMATSADPGYRRPEAIAQRDSIRRALRLELAALGRSFTARDDQQLTHAVLAGLTSRDPATGTTSRQAMVVLLAHQDAALFAAAAAAQRGVLLAAVLLALTVLAAGMLVVPMAWLYVRHKQGGVIAVKV